MPEESYRQTLKEAALEDDGFLRLTFSGGKPPCPWRKATVRPIQVGAQRLWQFSYFDARQDRSNNETREAAGPALDRLLDDRFTHIHLQGATADWHVRRTKKGKALVSRANPSRPGAAADLRHNRTKHYLLPERPDDPLLNALGLVDSAGAVRPTRRDKFLQINQFLNMLAPLVPDGDGELRLLDGGCGSAYLTFAAYHYLHNLRGRPLQAAGVDRDPGLVQKAEALRSRLGWAGPTFHAEAVADHAPASPPDIVLALHACDTATDEIIAQAVRWRSRLILAAPCCQHQLRPQLQTPPLAALSDGIIKQRSAELLTDAARAQLLRVLGYRTDIVEFVDTKHTPKNLMIRAVRTSAGDATAAAEAYRQLRDFWRIRPALEEMLAEQLAPFL